SSPRPSATWWRTPSAPRRPRGRSPSSARAGTRWSASTSPTRDRESTTATASASSPPSPAARAATASASASPSRAPSSRALAAASGSRSAMPPRARTSSSRSLRRPRRRTAIGARIGRMQRTLVDFLGAARRILVFTGAGISTGSGIPDFRGPQGIWKTRKPIYFDEFLASEEKRVEYWAGKLEAHALFREARPNAAHRAIAALERAGRVEAVVTQNIDGLHQAGGSSEAMVIEVHGTVRWIECTSCEAAPQAEAAA